VTVFRHVPKKHTWLMQASDLGSQIKDVLWLLQRLAIILNSSYKGK